MSFNLSFNVSEGSCCKVATLCDTTCLIEHYNKYTCADGYGVNGNITLEDVDYTRFDFKLPDGTLLSDVDLFWKPGTFSKFRFQVTAGTNGIFVLSVANVIIGQQYFVTDIDTTIALLIQNVNTLSVQTGWQAFLQDGSTDIIVIESIQYGSEYNGLAYDITVSGDIAVIAIAGDPLVTFNANGNSSSLKFGYDAIQGIVPATQENNFPDGVYEITYILYNSSNQAIGRSSIHVLFSCQLECIIRKLILLPVKEKCTCSEKFDDRLLELRLMLEKAGIQMDDCLFDCAQETMLLAHKMAKGICLDC